MKQFDIKLLKKFYKVEAASALAESHKRKSKKNGDSDSEQEIDEAKEVKEKNKGKKKDGPGFRDRKVCFMDFSGEISALKSIGM